MTKVCLDFAIVDSIVGTVLLAVIFLIAALLTGNSFFTRASLFFWSVAFGFAITTLIFIKYKTRRNHVKS